MPAFCRQQEGWVYLFSREKRMHDLWVGCTYLVGEVLHFVGNHNGWIWVSELSLPVSLPLTGESHRIRPPSGHSVDESEQVSRFRCRSLRRRSTFGSPLRTPHDSPHLFGRSDSVGLPPLREETGGEEKQCKK